MTTYDLNIWDWIGHNTNYKQEGWRIDIWECDDEYNRQGYDPIKIIHLTRTQEKMLTLGISEECGGDYGADDDFWIDPGAFFQTYKDIPRKVRRYLEAVA